MKDMAKISAKEDEKEVFRGEEYSSVFCSAEYELPGKADTESHTGWWSAAEGLKLGPTNILVKRPYFRP